MSKYSVVYRIISKHDQRNTLVEANSKDDAIKKAKVKLIAKFGNDIEIKSAIKIGK